MDLKGKCVLLGVTGGIAAYKMANVASALRKLGADVEVIMTKNATQFITPITFETLTGTITAITGTDALSTGNLLTRTVTISVRNAGGLTTAQAATATVNGVSSIGAAAFQYQAERTLTTLAAGTVTAIHARCRPRVHGWR